MSHTPGLTDIVVHYEIQDRITRAAQPHLPGHHRHHRGDRRHALARGLRLLAARIES